jgi:hypothetical protein
MIRKMKRRLNAPWIVTEVFEREEPPPPPDIDLIPQNCRVCTNAFQTFDVTDMNYLLCCHPDNQNANKTYLTLIIPKASKWVPRPSWCPFGASASLLYSCASCMMEWTENEVSYLKSHPKIKPICRECGKPVYLVVQ